MDNLKDNISSSEGKLPCHDLPLVKNGQSFGMFNGIRVVDVTTSVAGPYATMLMSDFGGMDIIPH